jgi:hypothetical protein
MIDPERKKFIFGKLDYKPHSREQQEIHDSDKRFRTLCCGRRWGKTTFGAKEMTAAICDPTQEGYYWIVGPNYVQGEKEFRIVVKDIGLLGLRTKVKIQYNIPQGLMTIRMPWDTMLEVKSAERQESLLGEGLKGVIMAEAARHSRDTWEQYVRPALSDKGADGERGWAIFTSTPRGFNWFQGLWLMGQLRSKHPNYASWRLPSWDNPIIYPGGRSDAEIEEIEDEVSKQFFSQEIAAEFTSFVGEIYDEFDPSVHVIPIEYNANWRNFWALDYGWTNEFVCLDIMVDPDDNVYVWREYHESYKSTFDHGLILKHQPNPPNFHVDSIFGDPRGPDQAATFAIHHGPVFSMAPKTNDQFSEWFIGIEQVKRWMKIRPDGKPKLYISDACPNLIRQMSQLRPPEGKEGKNAPEGQHKHDDHGPDALRYFFTQYFLMGAGSSLSDVYAPSQMQTEAAGFFRQNSPFVRQL